MKKEKFKLATKKGQIVYKIDINIRDENSSSCMTSCYPHGIIIKELKIVHQTQYKIALSDEWITLLDRQKEAQKKESYNHYLEEITVSVKTKETFWPNGIFAYCYTLDNPEKCLSKIKRKMIDQVNKDYGFLRLIDIESTLESLKIIKE